MAGNLWKPVSDRGQLVVLFQKRPGSVVIKDAQTGQVIERGVSSGPSNQRADTIRFSKPGSAFNNVIVETGSGESFLVENGSQRIENFTLSPPGSTPTSQTGVATLGGLAGGGGGGVTQSSNVQGGAPTPRTSETPTSAQAPAPAGGSPSIAGIAGAAATPFLVDQALSVIGGEAAAASAAPTVAGGLAQSAAQNAAFNAPATAATQAAAAPGVLASAAPIAAAPLAALTAQNTVSGVQNLLKGDSLSTTEEAALALPTFGASFLIDPIKGLFGSGKGREQKSRDAVRSNLQGLGLLDENFNLSLADGSKFDLGRDAGSTFTSFDKSRQVESGFERDVTNPLTAQAVGLVNPLAELVAGGDDKLRSDFASQFSNAVTSNATTPEETRQNALGLFKQLGINDANTGINLITELKSQGKVTDEEQLAFNNGINQLFGLSSLINPTVKAAPTSAPLPTVAPALQGLSSGGTAIPTPVPRPTPTSSLLVNPLLQNL